MNIMRQIEKLKSIDSKDNVIDTMFTSVQEFVYFLVQCQSSQEQTGWNNTVYCEPVTNDGNRSLLYVLDRSGDK